MKKCAILLLLALLISGCGAKLSEERIPATSPQLAEDIFTTPSEPTPLPANPVPETGSSIRIVNEVLQDQVGPYLVYEGGEMHLLLQMRVGDLGDGSFGIHLYADGQPQPYHTEAEPELKYMHTFPSMNGREFTLDLIFTPRSGQAGDVLEIGFAAIANPEYVPGGSWEEITMMDWNSMGMTIRTKYLADPPDGPLPDVPDRISSRAVEFIDLSAAEAEMFSSGEYQKEVEYALFVNGKKDYGDLSGLTADDTLEAEFELKGSSVPDFGLVLYLDHQPVSVEDEDLIFVRTEKGKRAIVRAQIDLSGFDGEVVLYAVLVPRNYRIDDLGGSCLLTILGPYNLYGTQ